MKDQQPNNVEPDAPDAQDEPDHQDNDHQDRDHLVTRSRVVFDDAVANLDGQTRSRLNQARQAALAAASPRHAPGTRWLLPAGSVAVLALASVFTVHMWQAARAPVTATHVASNAVDDFEIMTSDADLDMLQNMEFYAWLDTQDMNDATGEQG